MKIYFDKLDELKEWLLNYNHPPTLNEPSPPSPPLNTDSIHVPPGDICEPEEVKEIKEEDEEGVYPLPIRPGSWPLKILRLSVMAQSGLLEDSEKTLVESFMESYDLQVGASIENEEIRTLFRSIERNDYLGHTLLKPFKNKVQTNKYGDN